MDEAILETLKLANKAVEQTNKLNRHLTTCLSIILCTAFIVFGLCSAYSTHMTYAYDYQYSNSNVNRNVNENENESIGGH